MDVQNLPSAAPRSPPPALEQPVIQPRVEHGWMETWRPATTALQLRPRKFGAINLVGALTVLGFLFFTQILFLLLLLAAQ
jgi:hypothetical protein